MPSAKPAVAVIIPFYQTAPGLLATAVASVFGQDIARIGKVIVVVVDDGSPSNWRAEKLGEAPAGFELRIIEQANGGVSAARNAGLDAVDPSVEYIAFLDSDDQWFGNHLDGAVAALEGGEDLFFSDCYDSDKVRYFSFAQDSRIAALADGDSIAIDGASLFDTFLTGCFVHMSFTALRHSAASGLRFNEELDLTCEDQIFFLQLARRVRRAVIANRATGERGYGVSIYRSSLAWDSPTLLPRIGNQLSAAQYLIDHFKLRGDQRRRMKRARQDHIDELLFFGLRKLRHRPGAALSQLARIAARQPGIVAGIPQAIARIVSGHTYKRLLGT